MRSARVGLFVSWLLASCGGRASPAATTTGGRVYALSTGTPGQAGFSARALTIIDRATWTIVRSVPLEGTGRAFLSVDPTERLWVSRHGPDGNPDLIAQVFSAEGDKLADVPTCAGGHRAVFAAGLAWIACEANGFQGSLARVGLDDLAERGTVSLGFSGSDAFTVSAAAVVDGAVAVAGNINGGAGVLLQDPGFNQPAAMLTLGPGTSVVEVLAWGREGLFLNSISGLGAPPGSAPDVIELAGAAAPFVLTKLSLAPSPRAGVVVADDLYVYSFPTDANPAIVARRSLTTGAVTTWRSKLPGAVGAMATDGAAIFLAHAETTADAADGLYELDPTSGALTRRLSLSDASDLVVEAAAAVATP